uniref:Pex N-terminal domain-containing protein n=1 Tax=Oryza glaberrima TaxID=4538 RepID=I1QC35_ORYGL
MGYSEMAFGLYYHLPKRAAGIRYVFIGKPMIQRPRYQILGIFLLIQLCILGAERLRRSNLSTISSSINQISSGSYLSSREVALSFSEFMKPVLVLCQCFLFTCYMGIKCSNITYVNGKQVEVSHRIFGHMHGVLHIYKKINYTEYM